MKLWHIFFKYCFRYFIAFLLVLSCCLVLAVVSYRSIEGYVVKENEFKIKEGIDDIKESIAKMSFIPQMLKKSDSFITLTQLEKQAEAKNYIDLNSANREYGDIGVLYTFSDYTFTVFRNNDVFLSTGQCSAEFPKYFGEFLSVSADGISDSESFKNLVFEKLEGGELFWKTDSIEFYKQGKKIIINNPILCLMRDNTYFSPNPSSATVFVLNPAYLLKNIITQESFKHDTRVTIKNTENGSLLLSNNESLPKDTADDPEYQMVNYVIPEIGWTIDIAFPKSIIDKQCAEIRLVLYMYIGIGLLIVMVMTVIMSYRQYADIKRLFVHMPDKFRSIPKGEDEYEAIQALLSSVSSNNEKYKSEVEALTRQNQAIMLEGLILRGVNTLEERQQFEKYLPQIMDFFCVVLMEIESDELKLSNQAVLFIVEYLKKSYPHPFINVHTSIKNELFLLSFSLEDAPDIQKVQALFEKAVTALVDKTDIAFKVGISTIGSDLANINKCYNQAKQVVQANRWNHQSFVRSYQSEVGEIQENIVGMEFLDKLYNLLLCAENEAAEALLQKTFGRLKAAPFFYERHKEEIFYSIANIFRSAYSILAVDFTEQSDIASYDASNTAEEMAAAFLHTSRTFCKNVNEHKKSRNNELNEKIVSYLKESFINPSLNAGLVCGELGISEKYLFQFIKELTGESFAGYLEHIRIDAAVEYLSATDMSNEKIAKATGFAAVNTFYRVFNKRIGVSPGAYRSNQAH